MRPALKSVTAGTPAGQLQFPSHAPVRIRGPFVEAESGPLDLEAVLAALPRQPDLTAPAKLALTATGKPALLAEIPRDGDLPSAQDKARAALETGLRWLRCLAPDGRHEEDEAETGQRIEVALATGDWSWEKRDPCRFRARCRDIPGTQILVTALPTGSVRVALAQTPLRVREPDVGRALRLFALEASGRLRLVRVSIAPQQGSVAPVVREAVLPRDVPLHQWLPEAVEALAVAEAETRRALRALTHTAVARAYLTPRVGRTRPRLTG